MKSTEIRIKEDPHGKKAQSICDGWQQAEDLLREGEISQDRILELYNDTLKRAGLKQIDAPSVGRWMKDWLEGKRKIAPSTRLAYEQAVREFLEFLGTGQGRKLENITEKDIDAFSDHLLAQGRTPNTVDKLIRKFLSGHSRRQGSSERSNTTRSMAQTLWSRKSTSKMSFPRSRSRG